MATNGSIGLINDLVITIQTFCKTIILTFIFRFYPSRKDRIGISSQGEVVYFYEVLHLQVMTNPWLSDYSGDLNESTN